MNSYQKNELGLREAKCGVCKDPNYWNEILARRWNNIKSDPKILEWAIQPLKYSIECGEEEISVESVNGVSICESILLNYKEFIGENNIYQRLIKLIFPNDLHEHTIAKVRDYTVLEYYNAQPFLILALQNPDLVLTRNQRDVVVCYAHFQVENGTSIYGIEPYGLGYLILNSPIWPFGEKLKLVRCIWADEDDLREAIIKWKKDDREDISEHLRRIINKYSDEFGITKNKYFKK